MLKWAFAFFLISLAAAFLGYRDIAIISSQIAKILFLMFLFFAAVMLLFFLTFFARLIC